MALLEDYYNSPIEDTTDAENSSANKPSTATTTTSAPSSTNVTSTLQAPPMIAKDGTPYNPLQNTPVTDKGNGNVQVDWNKARADWKMTPLPANSTNTDYNPPKLMSYQDILSRLDKDSRVETPEQEKARLKREKANKIVAAVGDGISALSNIYFVGKGAPNANNGSANLSDAYKNIYDKLDAERKANIERRKQYIYNNLMTQQQRDYDSYNKGIAFEQARQKQAYEQYDKDRNYNLNVDKFGVDVQYKDATLKQGQQKLENDAAYRQAMIKLGQGNLALGQKRFREYARHNGVSESVAWYNATHKSNSTFNFGGSIKVGDKTVSEADMKDPKKVARLYQHLLQINPSLDARRTTNSLTGQPTGTATLKDMQSVVYQYLPDYPEALANYENGDKIDRNTKQSPKATVQSVVASGIRQGIPSAKPTHRTVPKTQQKKTSNSTKIKLSFK